MQSNRIYTKIKQIKQDDKLNIMSEKYKKTKLSPEQDSAANPTQNVWVQANAGTGKTSVLTDRLLRILFRTRDITKSGILCLTYTNAGAGEMRNRILQNLKNWALAPDDKMRELLDGIAINKNISRKSINYFCFSSLISSIR